MRQLTTLDVQLLNAEPTTTTGHVGGLSILGPRTSANGCTSPSRSAGGSFPCRVDRPGSPHPLHLAGARLLANYPVSAITDASGGLNTTVMSYDGKLDFGFVACRAPAELTKPAAEHTREA